MAGKLDGKIAVVTGGSAGIGLGTAKRFVAEGAQVFITGRRRSELDKAVADIGVNVTAIQADTAKLSDIDGIYQVVRAKAGRIDVMFANAGFYELARSARSPKSISTGRSTRTYAACCLPCKKHCRCFPGDHR